MGDSVPKHTGPIALTIPTSNPANPEPDRPPPERIVGDGKASFRETLKLLADSIVWRRTPLPSSKWLT